MPDANKGIGYMLNANKSIGDMPNAMKMPENSEYREIPIVLKNYFATHFTDLT